MLQKTKKGFKNKHIKDIVPKKKKKKKTYHHEHNKNLSEEKEKKVEYMRNYYLAHKK